MIKCNKCGYIGKNDEFPKGRDFFGIEYVSGCPKCDNYQSPGNASMRMFGGKRPFEFVRAKISNADPVEKVMHNASEAS